MPPLEIRPAPSRRLPAAAAGLAAVLAAATILAGFYEVERRREARTNAIRLTGGDPDRAPAHLRRYGCAGCHTIPGVPGADGLVGPPLSDLPRRVYVGGVLANTPDNLVTWIVDPRAASPRTAMPRTGISPGEARDVVAYLYSLR